MAFPIKLPPMLSHGASSNRVNQIGGEFLHWPQDKAVFKDVRTR